MPADAQDSDLWDAEREEVDAADAPDRGRGRWWLVGGGLIAVAIALTIWFAVSSTRGAVTATDIGFDQPSEREIIMVFDVTRPTGTPVSCTITAHDETYGRVGTATQTVPASDETTTRVRAPVRTTTPAVTATVQGCAAVD